VRIGAGVTTTNVISYVADVSKFGKEVNMNYSNRDKLLNRSFVPMPTKLLFDQSISPAAKIVYMAIVFHIWPKHKAGCWPSQELIAKKLGVSRAYVNKMLKELRNANYVDWKRRGQGKTNFYLLIDKS